MKIILLVLCAAAALSSSESYILRPQPVNVYYGVPRFQRGKSSTEYGRFTVIINKNPKTEEELKSLPDSRAVLDWAMKNGQYITENEIFKDKPQMLTFINGEKAKNRVFYTPGLNLRERLRRRRRQILEHKYPTAREMVLSRSQRAVPFLLPIFGVFGSITLFLAIYLPYQSDHSYLYNNNGLVNAGYLLTHEEERTRDITPAEMHLIEIINDNSKFEKQFIDGLSFDYFAFNRMHRAQLIQAAKEDKEKERAATKDAQNKQSDVSYYWHFNSNSGQGHFLNGVVNSHGNQPPTTPRPTPPTRRTPAPKLDLGNQKNRKRPAAAEVITLDDSDEQLDDTITLGDSDDEQNKSVVYIGNSDDSEIEILSPGVTPTPPPSGLPYGITPAPANIYDNPVPGPSSRNNNPVWPSAASSAVELVSWSVPEQLDQQVQEHHRARISATAILPRSRLGPTQTRASFIWTETVFTTSRRGIQTLDVFGLIWASGPILNSCTIDSFLSYIIIRNRYLQPNFAERYFLSRSSVVENSLRQILDMSREWRAPLKFHGGS